MKRVSSKLFFIFLTTMLLTSCSLTPQPAKVVKDFFKAVQESNYQKAEKYTDNIAIGELDSDDEYQKKLLKAINSKLRYEILSTESKVNQATVKVKVMILDLPQILSDQCLS